MTPLEERRLRACLGKHPFPSRGPAVGVAAKYGGSVYRCPFCRQWHVGGGKRERKRVRRR